MNRKLILFIISVYIITILVFRDLFLPIKINVNKIIFLKTFLSIIIPFCLTAVVYYISRLIKLDIQIGINIYKIIFTNGK